MSRQGVPRWLAAAGCALGGLAWAVYLIGPRPLLPGSVDWMLQEDWASTLLGWLYARTAPWGLPLGGAPGLLYPVGTSLAYTDSTPWWGLLFKALSPLLPPVFQIHGPWLALCFTLQGLFGALVVARLTPRPLMQLLGGLLFVMSPTLALRLGHASLCAHWLVLALLWLYLRPCPDPRTASRTVGLAAFFIAVASGVHVYLATMVLVLALVLLWRLWREGLVDGRRACLWGGGLGGLVLGVMTLLGYFARATTPAPGFNFYSSNLLTFIDPQGMSRLFPSFASGPGQYEGAGYLGVGVLGLGVLALGLLWAKRETHEALLPRSARPLLLVCGLMALFAVSARWQLAGWTVLSVQHATQGVLAPFAHVFRSSGRFIWPLHYLLILGAIAATLRVLRQRPAQATVALGLAVLLQALEVPAEAVSRARFTPQVQPVPGGDALWSLAAGAYRHVALYPARRVDGAGRGCEGAFSSAQILPFAWQAWRNGMTFNSAYLARLDERAALAACEREEADVRTGRVAADTVFVVHASVAESFRASTADQAVCAWVEDVMLCVSHEARGRFREELERRSGPRLSAGAPR